MGKPSMFSKNYEKSMRRRKKRKLITIIIICILIMSALTYTYLSNGKISKFIDNSKNKIINMKNNNPSNSESKTKQKSNEIKSDKNKVENGINEEYFKVTINNVDIKVICEVKDGNKLIKEVKNLPNEDMNYEISPDKKGILVYQYSMQKMFYIDNEGITKDISKEKYVSSKKTVFKRENIIKNKKDYVWCEKPRFINKNVIAFVSELPWLNSKNKKFIWFGNIQTMNYRYVRNKNGNDIEFKSLTDKGLETQIDGDIYYIDEDGIVSK